LSFKRRNHWSDTVIPITPGLSHSSSFTITLHDGTNPDITADTVTITFASEPGGVAILAPTANVTDEGATGTALIELTPANTTLLSEGFPYYDIVWTQGTNDYPMDEGQIPVMARVST
jgi:hypothetical protein